MFQTMVRSAVYKNREEMRWEVALLLSENLKVGAATIWTNRYQQPKNRLIDPSFID